MFGRIRGCGTVGIFGLESCMQIFNWVGVGAPNGYFVQGSTVYT